MTKREALTDDNNGVVASPSHLYSLEFGGETQREGGDTEEDNGEADDRNHSVLRLLHRIPEAFEVSRCQLIGGRDSRGFLECSVSCLSS